MKRKAPVQKGCTVHNLCPSQTLADLDAPQITLSQEDYSFAQAKVREALKVLVAAASKEIA